MVAMPTLTDVESTKVRERFQRLKEEWKEASRYMSKTGQMASLECYQKIIAMSWPVVPLILEELRREPDFWFKALETITGENPVPPAIAGKVALAAKAWLDWGLERGLIK